MRSIGATGILLFFLWVIPAAAQTYPYAAYCPFNKTINGVESALDVGVTETNCTGSPRNGMFSIIGNTGNPSVFCYVANRNNTRGVCAYIPNMYNRICPDNERYLNRAKTTAQCAAEGGTLTNFVAPYAPSMKVCRMPASSNAVVCAYYDYFFPIASCTEGAVDRPASAAACRALPDTFFDTVSQTCRSENPITPAAICRYLPQTITCPTIPLGLMEIDPAASATRCTAAGGAPITSNGPPPAAQCAVRGNANIFTVCAYRPAPIPPPRPTPLPQPLPPPTFPVTRYNTINTCMKSIGAGAQTQILKIPETKTNCERAGGVFTQDDFSEVQCTASTNAPIPNMCVYNQFVTYCSPSAFGTSISDFTSQCGLYGGIADTSNSNSWTCTNPTRSTPLDVCYPPIRPTTPAIPPVVAQPTRPCPTRHS